MVVSDLQTDFNISVADIFNFKTPRKISQNISFVKNNFKQRLMQIKMMYKAVKAHEAYSIELQNKMENYFNSIRSLPFVYSGKSLTNVLLTGATGFLGCNILNQLLDTTDYSVFLLIRANSNAEAFDRINKKFQLYFDKSLDGFYNHRLFIFNADLEKTDFGLSKCDYQTLVAQIDSIIHSAALTKHYGEYAKFHSANVQATIHLLELAKLTKLKDFHYISTSSVLTEGFIPNCTYHIFSEDDSADILEKSNVYVKSKYEGEKEVVKYRKYGVSSNIYRVGNLAFIADNCRAQQNLEDNAFFNRIMCLVNMGIMPREISMEEISPVDLTAQAIVKLFDKTLLNNKTYHVFNPYLYNIANIFTDNNDHHVRVESIDQFIDRILSYLDKPTHNKYIERFLLHQGWLDENFSKRTSIKIIMDKTQFILRQLNFEWHPVTDRMFKRYLSIKTEFENVEKNKNS